MRARSIVSAALLIAALCSPRAVAAPPSLSVVMGTVVDIKSGLPVPGASILLEANGSPVARTTTASDGTYKLPGVAPGVYQLVILARNYQLTQVVKLVVSPGAPEVRLRTALARGSLETIARGESSSNTVAR